MHATLVKDPQYFFCKEPGNSTQGIESLLQLLNYAVTGPEQQ